MVSEYEVLTLKELSAMLHIHPDSLYKLVRNGKIPSFRIGVQWRFRMDLLESWIAEQAGLRNLHRLPARRKPRARRVRPKAEKWGKLSMKHAGGIFHPRPAKPATQ
jgi:excisionase family DNA binding protein